MSTCRTGSSLLRTFRLFFLLRVVFERKKERSKKAPLEGGLGGEP